MAEEIRTKNWYDKSYKILLFIPLIFLLFCIVYLINFNSQNGDIIYKDVSLTGGTTISIIDSNIKVDELNGILKNKFSDISLRQISDFSTGEQKGIVIETKAEVEEIKTVLEDYLGYKLDQDNSSIEFSGSALSTGFYQQLRLAIIIAFIFMAIVVFIIFRTFVPSFAVIFAAFADIVMTVTVVDLLKINLSIAGIIGFLMLIGYSVDTDILLTSRVIKKRYGTINERIYGALKTGMMMTLTSIAAVGISLLITSGYSEVLKQIFTIVLIGLFFDIVNTWLTNASMIKWYVESRERIR